MGSDRLSGRMGTNGTSFGIGRVRTSPVCVFVKEKKFRNKNFIFIYTKDIV